MKKLRIFLVFLVSVIFLSFLTGCISSKNGENSTLEKFAIVDFEKAFQNHPLYTAWEQARATEISTQKLKENQILLLKKQAAFIDQMQYLQAEGRMGFLQADYAIRLSEAQLAERDYLQEIERKEKERLQVRIASRLEEIEEEYKLPLFNLKVTLEAIRPFPRQREEAEAKKTALLQELNQLQAEKQSKIDELYYENALILAETMRLYEEQSKEKLRNFAEDFFREVSQTSQDRLANQRGMLAEIPEAFDKTMASLDKQLLEQKINKDKIYTKIQDDIMSQVTKIALENNFTLVLQKPEVNIQAEDITEQVIEELKFR